MRALNIIVLIFLLASSCQQSEKSDKTYNWSEQEIKQYFIDSIAMGNGYYDNPDSLNKFSFFMKTFYNNSKALNNLDEFVYALDEPYVDPSQIDINKKWLRLIVKPTFSNPYCITLDRINKDTKVTFKVTNGKGGYYSGYLKFSNFAYFKDTLYNSYASRLDKINFWGIKGKDSTCDLVLDGTSYVFEAIDKGRYNIVYRHSPSFCSSNEAQELLKISKDLFEISDAKNLLKINDDAE